MAAPTKRKRHGAPSKAAAARVLRGIAAAVHLPVADPATRAADLRLIADCIESNTWNRGRKYPLDTQLMINEAAFRVEHRRSGVLVKDAVTLQAKLLAWELGWKLGQAGKQDAGHATLEEKLRPAIAQAYKVRRQRIRAKSGK